MAEATTTRAIIRRAICKDLRMPFFRRIGSSSTLAVPGSTTVLIKDAKLTQGDHFWDNSWFYKVSTGEKSLIRSFQAQADTFSLELPLAATPTNLDVYEIHSIWNADEIHEAINESIRLARRTFPETSTDESIVVCENLLTYSLSAIAPWNINRIYVEQASTVMRDTVTSATATTVTVPVGLTGVNTNWKITIYAGTGAGQIRAISSILGQELTVPIWTTTPDPTSKFALFNPLDQQYAWRLFNDFHPDNAEFPDTLYLNRLRAEHYGMRLRIQYTKTSSELTTDTDTTVVPLEYIRMKAESLLHGQLLSSSKVDKDSHYAEYKRLQEEADEYLIRNAPHAPSQVFQNPNLPSTNLGDQDNPLSWEWNR